MSLASVGRLSVLPFLRLSVNIFVTALNNLITVWNVLMILHSYVEQVMTMCRVQKRELLLYCLACEAEPRHMYCFSGVGGGGVNFFVFRSFSRKL